MENKQERILYMHYRGTRQSATVCGIYNLETKQISIGVALCNKKDTFQKARGRQISQARARKKPMSTHLTGEKVSWEFVELAEYTVKKVCGPRIKKNISGEKLAKLLFQYHTHGELVGSEQVVYKEEHVKAIIKALGGPEPVFKALETANSF